MTEQQIYKELTVIFHEVFGDDRISIHKDTIAADVPGWDSIKMVAIIIAVEEHFATRLRARDIDQMERVGDLVRLIQARMSSST